MHHHLCLIETIFKRQYLQEIHTYYGQTRGMNRWACELSGYALYGTNVNFKIFQCFGKNCWFIRSLNILIHNNEMKLVSILPTYFIKTSNSVGHWITCHSIVLILITSLSDTLLRMSMDPRIHLYVMLKYICRRYVQHGYLVPVDA